MYICSKIPFSHLLLPPEPIFTLKSLAILLCDLPSDHGVVWACGLAEEEWVDSGDAVGSCAPCCYPENALFYLLLDQALFGGGGGGAPNRNYAGA